MQGVENSNTSTLCPVSHCRVQIFLLLGGGARRGCLGSTVWASGLILSPFICCCHYSGVEQLLCSHLLHRGLSFECPPRQTEWCVLLGGQTEWCKVASFPLSLPGFLARSRHPLPYSSPRFTDRRASLKPDCPDVSRDPGSPLCGNGPFSSLSTDLRGSL